MSNRIARFVEPLLRLLLPGLGRHRLDAPSGAPLGDPLPVPSCPEPAEAHPLRGEDSPLVRPYLIAHERREEARRRRVRRRTLRYAVHGVDLGAQVIHAMEVAA